MTIKSLKEAREIIVNWNKMFPEEGHRHEIANGASDGHEYWQAKGALAAMEFEEVKGLAWAIEYFLSEKNAPVKDLVLMRDSVEKLSEALAKFKSSLGKES